MRIGIKEWVSTCREYEMDFTEKDLAEINIHIMMYTDTPVEPLTMEDIQAIYDYNSDLGRVRFRGSSVDTCLSDFIREWIDDELWDTEPYEREWNTDDVERWATDDD